MDKRVSESVSHSREFTKFGSLTEPWSNRATQMGKSHTSPEFSCEILGSPRKVDEIYALLGYYAASVVIPYRRFGTTYRSRL